MKQIQPVTIWVNGQETQANYLNAYIVNDNLSTAAVFYYELVRQITVNNETTTTSLANGNQTIDGQEYIDWGNSGDVNQEAYVILAQKLNLTLI